MGEIKADAAYFIKLGKKGAWEEECILQDNIIKLGFNNPLHYECLAGEWDKLYEYWIEQGKKKNKATETTNQIRTFYESGEDVLWITFFRRKLYWCFAKQNVVQLPDGTRIRYVKDKWSCRDIQGKPLALENLSGKLTRVQGFQGTICRVKEFDYLVRRINHQKLDIVQKAENTLETLLKDIEALIQSLTWKDFELLVDLIFARAGWQRTGSLGKTQKSIDLALMSPVTGNRAFVQVKSRASKHIFLDYVRQYQELDEFDEMYFVVHTKEGAFNSEGYMPDVKIWDVEKLSKLVVDSGLTSWLIEKTS